MRGKFSDPNYKLQFTGHETFPLRQLWLRKAYDAVMFFDKTAPRNIFSEPDAIEKFGVGRNMVPAIRHWAQACRVIQEVDGGGYKPGPIGIALFGPMALDPYLENPSSMWLVHWLVAGEGNRATTWHYLFNYVPVKPFEKTTLVSGLREILKNRPGIRATDETLKRDVDVCLRSYVPKENGDKDEELAEPVLAQLGLITAGGGSYDFYVGPKPLISDGIFLYALTAFWQQNFGTANTLSFELIALERGSPGLTFKLDVDSVAERLVDIERISCGVYAWSDTAGLKQVIRIKSVGPEHFLPMAYNKVEI